MLHEINLMTGFVLRWDTSDDAAQVIQGNDADADAAVDESAIEAEIHALIGRNGTCRTWDGIHDGSGIAICSFRWTDLTPAQRAETIAAAQKVAAEFVAEFGEPLDSAKTDWDATAWGEESLSYTADGGDALVEAGWELYVEILEAESARLCQDGE